MKVNQIITLTILLTSFSLVTFAQIPTTQLAGQKDGSNPISTAVPFLNITADSRAAGMGDVGVATSPDNYSNHWNNAKLAFMKSKVGGSFSYSPWLANIVTDMSLNYLTFHYNIDLLQSWGASFRYFDLGEIQLTDEQGGSLGLENPRDASIDVTYARLLGQNFSLGVTFRYIYSNLIGNITGATGASAGIAYAGDIGMYYTKPINFINIPSDLSLGLSITNFGTKITYSNADFEEYIPTNFRLGTALKLNNNPFNSFTFALDLNKLMVPSPPQYKRDNNGQYLTDANGKYIIEKGEDPNRPLLSGTFGSFFDAPGGFSEEISEISVAFGVEYWYRDLFAARTGFFYEDQKKGGRSYGTAGIGFRYQLFGLDVSYLIPYEQNHPLANTLRISLNYNFGTVSENKTLKPENDTE